LFKEVWGGTTSVTKPVGFTDPWLMRPTATIFGVFFFEDVLMIFASAATVVPIPFVVVNVSTAPLPGHRGTGGALADRKQS
jgi:hypothetical protein